MRSASFGSDQRQAAWAVLTSALARRVPTGCFRSAICLPDAGARFPADQRGRGQLRGTQTAPPPRRWVGT